MKLNKLTISNFMSFGVNVVVDLTNVSPPTLVQGQTVSADKSNGAGKSSLFEAAYWCWTGKMIRKISATEVIRLGTKVAFVETDFDYRGKHFIVSREYSEAKKRLIISCDGKVEEFHDSKQGTARLFELLEITPELLALACFSGRKFQTFSRLTPGARADLIDTLAQGSKWEEARDIVAKRAKAITKDMDYATTRKEACAANSAKFSLQLAEKQLKLDQIVRSNADRAAELKAELADNEALILITDKLVVGTKAELAAIAQPVQLLETIAAVNEEISVLQTEIGKLQNDISNAERELRIAEGQDLDRDQSIAADRLTISSNEREIRAQQSIIDKVLDLKIFDNEKNRLANELETGLCSGCGQKLPHDHDDDAAINRLADIEIQLTAMQAQDTDAKAKARNLVESYKTENGRLELAIVSRRNALVADKEAAITGASAVISKLRAQKVVIEGELTESQQYKAELTKQVADAGVNRVTLTGKLTTYETDVRRYRDSQVQLGLELKTIESDPQAAVLERECELLTGRVDEEDTLFKQQNETLATLGAELSKAKYWTQGFTDIRFSLFNGTVKVLEDLLNAFCSQQGLDFEKIEIDTWKLTTDNKAKPEINLYVMRDGKALSIDALSEGETQRVDLACFFAGSALIEQYLGFGLQLAVLDEPLTGLDYHGKQQVFDILQSISGKRQVFVIDHDSTFKTLFTNTITVHKAETSTVSIR